MSHTEDGPSTRAAVHRLYLRPLLAVAIGVCMLNTCLPTEVASFAEVQFTVDFTDRLRVPLNGSVTPSVAITIDGRPIANGQYRLESLNSQVATVDATRRAITGVQHDTTSVRVVFVSGVTGAAAPDTVIPIQVVVSDVEVAPSKDTLAWGETVQLTATALDVQGAAVSGLTFNWRSSNESVVTVDDAGLATGVGGAIGEALITADVDGVEGSHTIAVFVVVGTVLIDVPPDGDTLHFVGDESRFQAFAFDPNNDELEHARFTWASSNESVATVDSTGVVRATGAGWASITAMVAGVPGEADVVVGQVVAKVVLLPSVITLPGNGQTYQMSAALTDSGGASVQNELVDWMSADPLVVDVDASGLITARAPSGTTTVSATSSGVADTAEVSVVTVATVEIDRTTVVLAGVGDTTQLSAVARDAGGTAVQHVPFRWSSEDSQAASVDARGLVTGKERKAVTITVAAGTAASASAEVSVGWLKVYPSKGQDRDRPVHTCALTHGGAAYCWGNNSWGQFGNGTTADSVSTPVPAANGLRFTTLDAGWRHTCGLTTAGELYCWGANDRGQLGDGTTTDKPTPVPVTAGGMTFRMVSAGLEHTCAIAFGGTVYCWGRNSQGQLGDGTTTDRTQPTAVLIDSLQSIWSAGDWTCGLDAVRELHCWGEHTWDEFGDTLWASRFPVEVFPSFTFQSVISRCGLTPAPAGLVYCWGRAGVITGKGDELRGDSLYGPTQVVLGPGQFLSGVQLLTEGFTEGFPGACGLLDNGLAYCWGNATVPVPGNHTWMSLAGGAWNTCGITTEDRLYCWGINKYGSVGDGTTVNRPEPTRVLRP